MALDNETNPDLTFRIIGCAIEVHRRLGPGLLESVYLACLERELMLAALRVEREVPVRLEYKGVHLESSYRADMVVEGAILLELKAVEQLLPVHTTQLVTYLKLSGLKAGLLINFNVRVLKDGVRRFANSHLPADRPAVALPATLFDEGAGLRTIPVPP